MSFSAFYIASLYKRLLALIYDSFLVAAISMAVGWVYTGIVYQFIGSDSLPAWVLQLTLFPMLILSIAGYYFYCWRRSGQTLGMQTWRIRLISSQPLSYRQCLIRFAGAWLSFICAGAGFWILLFNKRITWHDSWSHTQVIDLRRPAQPSPA